MLLLYLLNAHREYVTFFVTVRSDGLPRFEERRQCGCRPYGAEPQIHQYRCSEGGYSLDSRPPPHYLPAGRARPPCEQTVFFLRPDVAAGVTLIGQHMALIVGHIHMPAINRQSGKAGVSRDHCTEPFTLSKQVTRLDKTRRKQYHRPRRAQPLRRRRVRLRWRPWHGHRAIPQYTAIAVASATRRPPGIPA